MEWPPDFLGELDRRLKLEHRLTAERELLAGALLQYAQSPADFICDCVYLHEPRNANSGEPVMLPVVLFPRQREFIAWLHERFTTKTSAPVEKSRDSPARRGCRRPSRCGCGCSIRARRSASARGRRSSSTAPATCRASSRKSARSSATFPHYLKPRGFKEHTHSNYMRLLNPENDSTIIGEAGDNIGRGGRMLAVLRRRGGLSRRTRTHRSRA